MLDEKDIRPVFIAGDEAQELVTQGDGEFAACSRESRGITIYATQTVSHFEKDMGKAHTNALLSCLRCGLYCRTDDPETAYWIRDSIGESINRGLNYGPESWTVDPQAFSTMLLRELKQGGGTDLKVEAVVALGGGKFKATGRRWYKATFRQRVSRAKDRAGLFARLLSSNDVLIVAKKPGTAAGGKKGNVEA